MKRHALRALHIIVASCSVASFFWVDRTTWEYGGAAWDYWTASWEARRDLPDWDASEEYEQKVAPLRHRAVEVASRRKAAWRASLGVFLLGASLLVVFRSKMAIFSFVVCAVATSYAYDRMGIRF